MKWSLVLVVFLGLIAAACAAGIVVLLPGLLNGPVARPQIDNTVEILVAQRPLPAMEVVEADSIARTRIVRESLPENVCTDPVQVIGQLLVAPLRQGQAFTKASFANQGSGAHLATALPEGMRAVGVALGYESGLLNLLYPGSMVDVIAVGAAGKGEAGSKTILQNVRVLAIEAQTQASLAESYTPGELDPNTKRVVTLMLDSKQAQLLQAAIGQGSIALSLRNPRDSSTVAPELVEQPAPEQPKPAEWEITVFRNNRWEQKKFSAAIQ